MDFNYTDNKIRCISIDTSVNWVIVVNQFNRWLLELNQQNITMSGKKENFLKFTVESTDNNITAVIKQLQ